jgi:hypothetical protein
LAVSADAPPATILGAPRERRIAEDNLNNMIDA